MVKPILIRKKVDVKISSDKLSTKRRIFASDFDSIIYNLIINSIESFEETKCESRQISIDLKTDSNFIINYHDNGHGLSEAFQSNPYSIFEYGVTSKHDAEGNQIGTGLGMYIVASSINEYNGGYTITQTQNGFGLRVTIPLESEVHKE
jgi:sensor histidine kinase regulating citrate/malate metabolism